MESTQVVIIGGGATGAGILWDLSLRGIDATLLEMGDIANGATGRCHGLLHSGGRYVVKDPGTARDCLAENRILKAIAPHCIEDIGGLFVQCPRDEPAFFEKWWRGAANAGIRSRRISADEALELEPNLTTDILGAFTSPDAHVDVFRLVLANMQAAQARGARVHPYSKVTSIQTVDGYVRGVRYRNTRNGEEEEISCDIVINAAGGWARQVAALAGVEVRVRCDKGTLLVLNHRPCGRVINRCREPGDGDILVPAGPVCILGTTSITVSGPDGLSPSHSEIESLLQLGDQMIPGVSTARVLRAFCGVRALYAANEASAAAGREVSRSFAMIDHGTLDGVRGLISIVGGKLTTYRLMAAAVCDCVSAKLSVDSECTTDRVPLRLAIHHKTHLRALTLLPQPVAAKLVLRLGPDAIHVLDAIESRPELAELACECEFVTRAEVQYAFASSMSLPAQTIADVGRRTRLGFGPCQGTFCGYKAMLAGYETNRWPASQAAAEFSFYLRERGQGQAFIHQGRQTEQTGIVPGHLRRCFVRRSPAHLQESGRWQWIAVVST